MYEIILFDLDGTLTDPKIGITSSVQYALQEMGIKEEDPDVLIPFIGPPLLASFKEFYHMSDQEAVQAIGYYRERFSVTGLYENKVYAGMEELLASLKNQGKKLIVATSKPTEFSVQILEHFGLKQYFAAIVGSNIDGTRTEKSDVIEFALTGENITDLSKVVMIGDRKYDISGAKKNHIDVIAVAYGYGSQEELAAADPNYIVSSVSELASLLGRL
ncbi:HAD family hydrolase [Pelosinus fermentans]|uniref:HAD-superfamily hydrolase, subfamily IA, variant 1 n=1 Tax=Pelosinus fermentans JBW45 TaxID=1192197 RepID=I8U3X3_9FIRM|nr:HAD family hydrolase [Pelosinus fermentans]AJQ25393.1 HAD-superfamily hydrolase, subfamily IA, variant 1 [Pelosinus fermentans JBW45]